MLLLSMLGFADFDLTGWVILHLNPVLYRSIRILAHLKMYCIRVESKCILSFSYESPPILINLHKSPAQTWRYRKIGLWSGFHWIFALQVRWQPTDICQDYTVANLLDAWNSPVKLIIDWWIWQKQAPEALNHEQWRRARHCHTVRELEKSSISSRSDKD